MTAGFRLEDLPRAGAPRIERLARVRADIDVHALALGLSCPALFERGGEGRGFHVLPLFPRGVLDVHGGDVILAWADPHGGMRRWTGRGLDALRELLRALACPRPDRDVPFAGGVALMLGYGLAHEIETLPSQAEDRDDLPTLHAQACPGAVLVPCGGGDALLAWLPSESSGDGPRWGLDDHEAALHAAWARRVLADPPASHESGHRGGPIGAPRPLWSRADHEAAIRAVIEELHAGEIYQANLTQRFEIGWEGSALPLHAILRRRNPSPHSGWMRAMGDEWQLVSGSPERLVRLRGTELVTEPIKGTVALPRDHEPSEAELEALSRRLLDSAKDRAEHVMIVDLHRNDLGRVSAPGSVRVESMMRVDRRSHVLQAVADIRGTLAEGRDAVDVIEAMFPGGSVTGVPKIRAMEILDSLERSARGPYTGSFGYVSSWGDMDMNIVIRSAWQRSGRLAFSAGGGIVLASDPAQEYEESLVKAAALREAIEELAAERE